MRELFERMNWFQRFMGIVVILLIVYTDIAFRNQDFPLAFLSMGSAILTALILSFTTKRK